MMVSFIYELIKSNFYYSEIDISLIWFLVLFYFGVIPGRCARFTLGSVLRAYSWQEPEIYMRCQRSSALFTHNVPSS